MGLLINNPVQGHVFLEEKGSSKIDPTLWNMGTKDLKDSHWEVHSLSMWLVHPMSMAAPLGIGDITPWAPGGYLVMDIASG